MAINPNVFQESRSSGRAGTHTHGSLLAAMFILCVMLVSNGRTQAQVWSKSGAPTKSWLAVAGSADGSVLAAITGTSVYLSTDAGTTWVATAAPAKNWNTLALSGDGKLLLAAAPSQGVYSSTNNGNTWVSNSIVPNADFDASAASSDGATLMVAAQVFGPVYYSTNHGANWNSNGVPGGYWTSAACSADGTKMAAFWGGTLYASTNSGGSWYSTNGFSANSVICSADGRYLMLPGNGQLSLSTNWGFNWSTLVMPLSQTIGVSRNGNRIVAMTSGTVNVSENFGSTWFPSYGLPKGWKTSALSADGTHLVAAPNAFDGLYLWTPPQLVLTNFDNTNFAAMWSTNGTFFFLQKSTDLAASNWANVPAMPMITNSMAEVIVSPTNGRGFFRLYTP